MADLRYLAIKDSNGKWYIQGAYSLSNIETLLGEAIDTYGQENVTLAISPKEVDQLNRERMVGQMKAVGQKVSAGLGGIAEGYEKYADQTRPARSRPLMQPTAKPTMAPPKPYTSGGMMPPPSQYAKAQQNHPQEQPQQKHFTKWGRPLKPTNVFRDCRFTAPYIIRQQRQAMASNRRYNRRR